MTTTPHHVENGGERPASAPVRNPAPHDPTASRGCPVTAAQDSPAAHGSPADRIRLYEPTPPEGRTKLWKRLRERHGPLVPVELEPGVRAWLLLDYRETLTLLQQPHLFARDTRKWREAVEGRVDLDRTVPMMTWLPNALYADGAEHARLRAPIMDGLTRIDMNGMARTVRRIADELVDSFVTRGSADLIGDYAGQLPALVVNRLFGLPDSYGHMLNGLTALIFHEDAQRTDEAINGMRQYFAGLVSRKADAPGDDLVSQMMAHPSKLTPLEVAYEASLIVSASHMMTAHLIGNTMRTLLTDDRIRSAHTDARLSTHDLLDHVMWNDSPLQLLAGRIVLQDVRIGKARIRKGDAIYLGVEGAHHDPAVRVGRPDPDTGLASGSRAHLAFGAGPHSCPAREMGRLVASTGVTVLQERLGGLRLAVDPRELRPLASPFLHGVRELPVAFQPGRPSEPPAAQTQQMEQVPPVAEEEQPPEDLLGRLLNWWRGLGS
ncbi:cytochrome P450 [Nocardiopsis metallicus]|uniref:Cytochrome P450 n=1 Tax=Nocardiopsis metallicus TaxID=179819 RepID=A0A840WDJ6_9ACTN|nr:cytochrome P450 [Nocardiopsis metallicus]MBB5494194.1 cytochrome P450 [Nocardiopsis metallicus]